MYATVNVCSHFVYKRSLYHCLVSPANECFKHPLKLPTFAHPLTYVTLLSLAALSQKLFTSLSLLDFVFFHNPTFNETSIEMYATAGL